MPQGKIFCLILFLILANIAFCQEIKHPFPQHTVYNKHTIKPNKLSQTEYDNTVIRFYAKWKQHYVRHNCKDPNQYYVFDDEDPEKGEQGHSICVSEGQGYGMLIMVMMAGHDAEAQKIFDGMYRFYIAHPSKASRYLMSWSILNNCVTNKQNENQSSASDGDFDIALSLLMAGEQWGNAGKINYKAEALKMLEAILKQEINPKTHTILLSNANTPDDYDYYDIRTSDFMPDHLVVFNKYLPNKAWLETLNETYKIFHQIQQKYSSEPGLLPDFIIYRNKTYTPAKANYLESKYDGDYYFNACRVPMRVALDKLLFGNMQADTLLHTFNNWIQNTTDNNVDKIVSGYYLNGNRIGNRDSNIPSFVCPLAISSMLMDSSNQEWLNDCWDTIQDFDFNDYQYYDNSVEMLSLLILTGNYWLP